MDPRFFHSVFVIYFLAFVLIRMAYKRMADRTQGKVDYKEGNLHLGLRLSLGLMWLGSMIVYAFDPGLFVRADFVLAAWAQVVGVGLGAVSLLLLLWVQQALGSNFSTTLHIRDEHTLVRHGPYRWVRHPMYTVLFLLIVAWLLLSHNWLIGGVPLAALVVIVALRLPREEAAMVEKFGHDYREYMRTTGRFLPAFPQPV